MARILVSSPPFADSFLPYISRHGLYAVPKRSRYASTTRVRLSLHDLGSPADLDALVTKAESLLYTLVDAAVAASPAADGAASDSAVQKSGGWFGFISDAMEVVLKILKDLLAGVHVPYAYGFAIVLLTAIVKVATLPLTKQQVESTLAMQNLQPKIKAIQERYAGNQKREGDTKAYTKGHQGIVPGAFASR